MYDIKALYEAASVEDAIRLRLEHRPQVRPVNQPVRRPPFRRDERLNLAQRHPEPLQVVEPEARDRGVRGRGATRA